MKGFIRLILVGAMITTLLSCASQPSEEDESLTTQAYGNGDKAAASSGDEFSDFDKSGDNGGNKAEAAPQQAPAAKGDSDLALEDEMNKNNGEDHAKQFEDNDVDKQAAAKNEMQPQQPPPAAENPPPAAENPPPAPPAEPPPPVVAQEEPPPPAAEPPPAAPEAAPAPQEVQAPAPAPEKAVDITDLKYKANDAGGTVIIESNGPMTYTTRANADLKQFVIEIPNSNLPKRLKRTLNTKDIKGAVGAVDAYQSSGSNVSRIVVQLRDGASEPTVQQEGNSLLVITNANQAEATNTPKEAGGGNETVSGGGEASVASNDEGGSNESAAVATDSEGNVDLNDNKILTSQTLEQYLAGNNKFYGRKISIETSHIDIRDALKFITEESGVNMVIADEVKGNISLKLRQVPWDQALVLIMKARRLGYSRQGSILRIEPIEELKKEEEDATKLAAIRRNTEPLKVKMFSVSYAKVDELDRKVKEFLTDRGKVVSDLRTNALVVTDIQESLTRVSKLIQSLDVAPPQVLIEGKIVEATDTFARAVGVNWGFNGVATNITNGGHGPVTLTPSTNVGNTANLQNGGMSLGLNIGTLDIFGNLTASLALYEREDKVKVLSSPRIVTLTNEKADISQTNELPVKTLTPQTAGPPLITYQFKPLTLKLEVTPQITTEGTIIMKVAVSRQIQGPPVSTNDDTFSVNSREANTRVIVKNGQTAVIGGIYRTDLTDTVEGVPGLKDVPILGALFRSTNVKKEHSELLIFLTPRVLAQLDTGGAKPVSGDQ